MLVPKLIIVREGTPTPDDVVGCSHDIISGERMRWFMHSCRIQLMGMWVDVQANQYGSPAHVQCFSH